MMVDTIHLTIPIEELGGYDGWLQNASNIPDRLTKSEKPNGFRYSHGHVENLRFYVDERELKMQGSFPKFLYGNNFEKPQRNDFVAWVDCMSDTLNCDIGKGKINRLDFGENITCEYPPLTYIQSFTASQYFTRFTYPASIRYQNSNRQYVFYDKKAHAKKNKEIIPKNFKNEHVIRLEARLMNHEEIKKRLMTDGRLDSLRSESTWEKMAEIWEKMYFHFNREKEVSLDFDKLNSPANVINFFAVEWINSIGGMAGVNKMLELMKSADAFKHRSYYSNVKKKCRELVHNFSDGKESPYLLELDSKVKAACLKEGEEINLPP